MCDTRQLNRIECTHFNIQYARMIHTSKHICMYMQSSVSSKQRAQSSSSGSSVSDSRDSLCVQKCNIIDHHINVSLLSMPPHTRFYNFYSYFVRIIIKFLEKQLQQIYISCKVTAAVAAACCLLLHTLDTYTRHDSSGQRRANSFKIWILHLSKRPRLWASSVECALWQRRQCEMLSAWQRDNV